MKKKILLIFSLLLSIVFINTVNAEDLFYFGWQTELIRNSIDATGFAIEGGYLTYDLVYGETILNMYDESGKLIKTKEIEDTEIYGFAINGSDIYAFIHDLFDGYWYIGLFDKNLELMSKYVVESDPAVLNYSYHRFFINELSCLKFIDGNVYALEYGIDEDYIVEKILPDLSDSELIDNQNTIEQLFELPKAEDVITNFMSNYDYMDEEIFVDYQNGKYLISFGVSKKEEHCWTYGKCYTRKVFLVENGKELLSIELPEEDSYMWELKFIGDYFVIDSTHNYSNSFLIYNLNGEQIQKFTFDDMIYSIEATPKGFIISRGISEWSTPIDFDKTNEQYRNNPTRKDYDRSNYMVHEVFYRYFDVSTKVSSGKGSITVDQEHQLGDQVTFTVTPDEGYVLKSVKVTDSEGNTVTFTENQFTMPADDITIEAEFEKIEENVKENPNTKDIAIIFVLILAITTCIITLTLCKKIKRVGC